MIRLIRIRRHLASALLLGSAGVVAVSCADSGDESSGGKGAGGAGGCVTNCPDSGAFDAAIDFIQPTSDAEADGTPGPVNPLCGSGCVPDDVEACLDFDGGLGSDDAGPMSDASVDSGDAGAGDGGDAQTHVPEGGDGAPASADGGGDAGGSSDSGLDAMMKIIDGAVPAPPPSEGMKPSGDEPEPGPPFGCHVRRGAAGEPVASCEPAGAGRSGDPCMTSRDCAAGYGCIGADQSGTCRPFCCGDTEACEGGTYCSERPLRDDANGNTMLVVPACVPADDCNLADPYPCPAGQSCTCPEDTACTIVRADGTTSCVTPGTGGAGDPCPCAAGHICSMATQNCLKICSLNAASPDCGSGKCQATNGFPEGFGVCVGASADGG